MKRYPCSNLLVLCILFTIACMIILTIAKYRKLEKVETQETLEIAATNDFDGTFNHTGTEQTSNGASQYQTYNSTLAMERRINNIRKLCNQQKYQYTRDKNFGGKSIVSLDRTRVTYCPVPKAGWSTWKGLFYQEAGIAHLMSDLSHTGYGSEWGKAGLTVMANNNLPATAIRMVFVRNPYKRLVSAYKDKVLRNDGRYIKQWQSLSCPSATLSSLPGPPLTFSQFVTSCVVDMAYGKIKNLTEFGAGENLDPHWKPQTLLCNFCSANYNIIGHLEHMDDDVSSVIKQLYMTNVRRWRLNASTQGNLESAASWYNQLNQTQLSQLSQLYSHDFALLGYHSDLLTKSID